MTLSATTFLYTRFMLILSHYILQDEFFEITDTLTPQIPSFASRLYNAIFDGAVWFILLLLILSPIIINLKRSWLRYVLLGAALLFLGFYRGGCPCPVTAHAQTAALLSSASPYWITPALLFVTVVLSAVLFGRFFCGYVCPLGAVQELMAMVRKKHLRLSRRTAALSVYLRMIVFCGMLFAAWKTGSYHFRELDPFRTLFIFKGTIIAWLTLAGTLLLSVFIQRPFCRFVCPLGGVLELLSRISFLKIHLTTACVSCKKCTSLCPVDAITTNGTLDNGACIRCGQCIAHTQCFRFGTTSIKQQKTT